MAMNLKSSEYVLPLADRHTTLETVGGKGASLARLVNAELPVPDGFHVTTAAYKQFVAENGLQPRILAILEQVDPAQPATLEATSQAIRELFEGAEMPAAIAGAVAHRIPPWPYVRRPRPRICQRPALPVSKIPIST